MTSNILLILENIRTTRKHQFGFTNKNKNRNSGLKLKNKNKKRARKPIMSPYGLSTFSFSSVYILSSINNS